MSAGDREAVLRPLRDRIDAIDEQLVALLAERMRVVDKVLVLKQAHGIAARLEHRVEEVVAHVRVQAERLGAPADLVEPLWRRMIDWVIAYEDTHLDATPPGSDDAR